MRFENRQKLTKREKRSNKDINPEKEKAEAEVYLYNRERNKREIAVNQTSTKPH